ncbi:hypothetical protein BS78_04G276700 [Paspalum vaginatum]|nr:hypothetical protein BS78_04G276700 [Paspalum vaginatum]
MRRAAQKAARFALHDATAARGLHVQLALRNSVSCSCAAARLPRARRSWASSTRAASTPTAIPTSSAAASTPSVSAAGSSPRATTHQDGPNTPTAVSIYTRISKPLHLFISYLMHATRRLAWRFAELEKHIADAHVLITTPFHPAYATAGRIARAKNLELLLTAGIGSDLPAAFAAGLTVAEVTGSRTTASQYPRGRTPDARRPRCPSQSPLPAQNYIVKASSPVNTSEHLPRRSCTVGSLLLPQCPLKLLYESQHK